MAMKRLGYIVIGATPRNYVFGSRNLVYTSSLGRRGRGRDYFLNHSSTRTG